MSESYESSFRAREFWLILITGMFVLSAGISMIFNQPATAVRAPPNHVNDFEYQLSEILFLSPLIQQIQTMEPTSGNNNNNDNSSNLTHTFVDSFTSLVNDSRSISIAFQDEIAKWQSGMINNKTMAAITNAYLPQYQEILNRTEALQVPPSAPSYDNAVGNLSKSIESEITSNKHIANYLTNGNQTENELSLQLLSDAFLYERKAFDAFESARRK